MSNEVQFDIDQVQRTSFNSKESIFVRLVTNYSGGLIKDERQANYVLLGFAMLLIVISLLLFSGVNIKRGPDIPPSVPTSIPTSAL